MTAIAIISTVIMVVCLGLDVGTTYFALRDNPSAEEVGPVARKLFGPRPELWELIVLKAAAFPGLVLLWAFGGPAPAIAYNAVLAFAHIWLAVRNGRFVRI